MKLIRLVGIVLNTALFGFFVWMTWFRWSHDQDFLIPILLYFVLRTWIKTFDLNLKLNELLDRPAQIVPAYKRKRGEE